LKSGVERSSYFQHNDDRQLLEHCPMLLYNEQKEIIRKIKRQARRFMKKNIILQSTNTKNWTVCMMIVIVIKNIIRYYNDYEYVLM